MSKFIKGAGGLVNNALKIAFSAIITGIAGDILKESGAANIAKDKIMDTGFKVVKDMKMDKNSIQEELIKSAIKKELKL